MTVETPDHYGGKPIPEDAIEIALANAKREKEGGENTEVEAPSLNGYIYVPSIDLHFAKERSHLGENWYDTHRDLDKQNLRMPTITEFVEFLKYLRADPTAENTRVYNEITEKRDPWKAEWFDAKFYKKDGELWVAYNHIVNLKGDLEAKGNERLEGHLMKHKLLGVSLEHWLNNPTKQGLPPADAKQGDLGYWYPRGNRVARFYADSDGACLNCCGGPGNSDSTLGVRAVRTSTQNAGEKQ